MGRKLTPCISCKKLCNGERCRSCYAVVMSKTRRGENNPMYGRKATKAQIEGARKAGTKTWKKNFTINKVIGGAGKKTQFKKGHTTWNKGIKGANSHWYGRKHNDETKQKCREARMKQVMVTESRQERIMQDLLDREGIEFETHKKIFGEPDIFIKPNICVFVDGVYWHNYPKGTKRDHEVNRRLDKEGYEVVRYWQHDIEEDTENVLIDLLIRIGKD